MNSPSTPPAAEIVREQTFSLEELLEQTAEPTVDTRGVFVGKIVGSRDDGLWLVEISGLGCIASRSFVAISAADIGRDAAVMFERGELASPLVMGLMHAPEASVDFKPVDPLPGEEHEHVQASLDGERLVLAAEREIVLQCGRASITLTSAGKVLIRGAYVSSRSTGVNRIHGGSVQIN